jgi:PPE-repeat protein
VIESVLGGLFSSIQPYLPYTAATTMGGTALGRAAFGPANCASTTAVPLPFAAAAALLAGLAVLLSVVAARTTVVRDVS